MITCEFTQLGAITDRNKTLERAIKKTVKDTIKREGIFSAKVVIAFGTDEEICVLNRDFREKDTATDVLSFPAMELSGPLKELREAGTADCDFSKPLFLGDIAISLDTAKKQAEEYGNTFTEEVCFLCVHGTLHLLGYDHILPEDEKKMREKQKQAREARKK